MPQIFYYPMTIQSTHLIVSEHNQLSAIYTKKKLKELDISHSPYTAGNIYIGQLESIVPNINAAFISLDKNEKNGFIQLDNLLPTKTKQKYNQRPHNLTLKSSILVQITKEPTGTKGPTLTTNIGIIGKYVILLPFREGISVSKKLTNYKEKQALRALFALLKPNSIGLLIKKEASKVSEIELIQDFLIVKKNWTNICRKTRRTTTPKALTNKTDFVRKALTNFYTTRTTKISVDTCKGAWKLYSHLTKSQAPKREERLVIEYYTNKVSLIKNLVLDLTIYATLQPRINLVTGGHIIIEKTEALTAIDINSGSFNQLTNSRATLLWINCEAATEIARQLKLRNLGGIIVVDFIDMVYQRDQMTLLNHFNHLLKKDVGNPKIIQLSEIGLVELTRKRQGQNIYDIFGHTCSRCSGLGQIFKFATVNKTEKLTSLETSSIFLGATL